jgi:ribosomal-protein-serine acetyltransferase
MRATEPMLLEFPDSFETNRLTIRSPFPGDGAELRVAVGETIEELRSWMAWADHVPTVEEQEELVRQGRTRFLRREDLWLLLFLKGTHTLVGCSGLHNIDWQVPRFEIGYWVRRRYGGQGYITEAVRGEWTSAVTRAMRAARPWPSDPVSGWKPDCASIWWHWTACCAIH